MMHWVFDNQTSFDPLTIFSWKGEFVLYCRLFLSTVFSPWPFFDLDLGATIFTIWIKLGSYLSNILKQGVDRAQTVSRVTAFTPFSLADRMLFSESLKSCKQIPIPHLFISKQFNL